MVEVDEKVVRRGAGAILVFVFAHFDFPDKQFYSAKRYIHVTQEGEEDSLFVLVEAVIIAVSAGAIGPLIFNQSNRDDGAEANDAPTLLSGRTSNIRRKTWWSFAAKGFISTMITIQHQRISHDRVRILLAQVIG